MLFDIIYYNSIDIYNLDKLYYTKYHINIRYKYDTFSDDY